MLLRSWLVPFTPRGGRLSPAIVWSTGAMAPAYASWAFATPCRVALRAERRGVLLVLAGTSRARPRRSAPCSRRRQPTACSCLRAPAFGLPVARGAGDTGAVVTARGARAAFPLAATVTRVLDLDGAEQERRKVKQVRQSRRMGRARGIGRKRRGMRAERRQERRRAERPQADKNEQELLDSLRHSDFSTVTCGNPVQAVLKTKTFRSGRPKDLHNPLWIHKISTGESEGVTTPITRTLGPVQLTAKPLSV
jgi:hypothetical protein